jgi:DNA polymerase I-like protein with 3'-5' exonuclease and polymerase domains
LRFPGVYRIDIEQGNIVTADMLEKLKPGMTEAQVQAYADIYAQTYAGVVGYRKQLLDHHRAHNFVRLFLGRTRHLPDIDWSNSYSVHKAETTTSNNVIQGTGQDFLKAAIVRADYDNANPDQRMLDKYTLPKEHRLILSDYAPRLEKLRRQLRKASSRFILQVHDEVLFTCDKAAAAECLHIWCTLMTWRHFFPAISDYNVPLVAEGGWGANWEQAKSEKGHDHIKLGYEEWARYANS